MKSSERLKLEEVAFALRSHKHEANQVTEWLSMCDRWIVKVMRELLNYYVLLFAPRC